MGITNLDVLQVNQLIGEFNNLRQEAVSAYGSSSFASYPSLAPLQWYYQFRYKGVVYQRGAFSSRDQMASDFTALKRSYPSIVLIRYYTR